MRSNYSSSTLLLLTLLLIAGGCARFPAAVERPAPLSSEEWIARLQSRAEHWQAYQAKLHLKAESSRGTYPLRAVVLAKLPDHFRLEAFNLFGQTIGVLVLNAEGTRLWVPADKAVYTAQRTASLTQHFIGAAIPLESFGYSLIAGVSPEHLKQFKIRRESSRWLGKSEVATRGLDFTWEFLSQPPAMKALDAREGPWSYAITYEPPVELVPQTAPSSIRYESSEWKMEVTVDQIQQFPGMDDSVFYPSFPSGIRNISLDHAK